MLYKFSLNNKMLNNKKLNNKMLVLTLVITLFCSLLYGWVISRPASATNGEKLTITVKPGMTAQDIGRLLYTNGLIKNVTIFRIVAQQNGMENSLQAGDYAFTRGMMLQRIVEMLSKGEVAYRQITIPEGYTVEQIAKLIETEKLGSAAQIKSLAQSLAPYDYIGANNQPKVLYKSEGYIFPDTYQFSRNITEEEILRTMMAQFDKKFTPRMRERAGELNMSMSEVVILASLVEKEARLEEDRPIIAGVFLNRLKENMPLQSCATIQYILGYPKPELSVQDTEISSPYNTYQNMGLPPGPIANPGLASIQAVLYPAETDYLFFVADKQGAHHFSKTYEEHLSTIEQVR